jgi:RHH-type rel operon transcriptional repressor/antitoxin RelB
MVSLRLDPATDRKLAREAKRKGRTKTALARAALIDWLDEQEDVRLAEERLQRLGSGKSRTFTADEVKRELGVAI